MKEIFTAFLCVLFCSGAYSQKFGVDTLYKTGPIEHRLNVVILGDGFTEEELPTFKKEAKKFADFFLSYEPYNHYQNYFNFFDIPTPSKESGVTNPGTAPDRYPEQPVGVKDTFYGATFGPTIHRGVYITKYDVLYSVLGTNFPAYDLVIVLVNTPFYGGTGGGISVHTLHSSANTIGVHEVGHTLTNLTDEYWYGGGWEAPNMTQNNNPLTARWKNWINDFNVGLYQYGFFDGAETWFKPTNGRCLMEYLSQPMCAVCVEATTEKILSLVSPVEKTEPETTAIVTLNSPKTFKLQLLRPQPNTLSVAWFLDDVPLKKGVDQITLEPKNVRDNSILTATVFDSTQSSRSDNARNQRTWVAQWSLRSSLWIESSADSVCSGTTVSLTATGCPGTITWSTGESRNAIAINPNRSGKYTAYCKVQEKVKDSVSVNVGVYTPSIATASNNGPYLVGSTISLNATGGVTYDWIGPLNFHSSEQNPVIHDSKTGHAGLYVVSVTDKNGCIAKQQTQVQVDPILGVGKEPEAFVIISPNPTKDFIKVQTRLSGFSEIKIYDLKGQELHSRSFQGTTEIKMNTTPGTYLYRFSNPRGKGAGKLVVH